MRILLQRVSRAEVRVRSTDTGGAARIAGRIGAGYVVLVGITHADTLTEAEWLADKVSSIRLFPDTEGRLNFDLTEYGGAVLVVSQFTLYGDARKGRRPSFLAAASPASADVLYRQFVQLLRDKQLTVETGEFGELMDVELVNDGPVTLWLEREPPAPPTTKLHIQNK